MLRCDRRLSCSTTGEYEMKFDVQKIQTMAKLTLATRPEEITCDEWLVLVGRYVDLKLSGASIPEDLKPVVEHLELCSDCAEELAGLERALAM